MNGPYRVLLASLCVSVLLCLIASLPRSASAVRPENALLSTSCASDGTTTLLSVFAPARRRRPRPALKKELPLEMAKNSARGGRDEPDTLKRLGLYRETRGNSISSSLKQETTRARGGQARSGPCARASGRTELSRAWLQMHSKARVDEGLKARATFVEAAPAFAGCLRRDRQRRSTWVREFVHRGRQVFGQAASRAVPRV